MADANANKINNNSSIQIIPFIKKLISNYFYVFYDKNKTISLSGIEEEYVEIIFSNYLKDYERLVFESKQYIYDLAIKYLKPKVSKNEEKDAILSGYIKISGIFNTQHSKKQTPFEFFEPKYYYEMSAENVALANELFAKMKGVQEDKKEEIKEKEEDKIIIYTPVKENKEICKDHYVPNDMMTRMPNFAFKLVPGGINKEKVEDRDKKDKKVFITEVLYFIGNFQNIITNITSYVTDTINYYVNFAKSQIKKATEYLQLGKEFFMNFINDLYRQVFEEVDKFIAKIIEKINEYKRKFQKRIAWGVAKMIANFANKSTERLEKNMEKKIKNETITLKNKATIALQQAINKLCVAMHIMKPPVEITPEEVTIAALPDFGIEDITAHLEKIKQGKEALTGPEEALKAIIDVYGIDNAELSKLADQRVQEAIDSLDTNSSDADVFNEIEKNYSMYVENILKIDTTKKDFSTYQHIVYKNNKYHFELINKVYTREQIINEAKLTAEARKNYQKNVIKKGTQKWYNYGMVVITVDQIKEGLRQKLSSQVAINEAKKAEQLKKEEEKKKALTPETQDQFYFDYKDIYDLFTVYGLKWEYKEPDPNDPNYVDLNHFKRNKKKLPKPLFEPEKWARIKNFNTISENPEEINNGITWQFNELKSQYPPIISAIYEGRVTKIDKVEKTINIFIEHIDGYTSVYQKLIKSFVKEGEMVRLGQPIGRLHSGDEITHLYLGIGNKYPSLKLNSTDAEISSMVQNEAKIEFEEYKALYEKFLNKLSPQKTTTDNKNTKDKKASEKEKKPVEIIISDDEIRKLQNKINSLHITGNDAGVSFDLSAIKKPTTSEEYQKLIYNITTLEHTFKRSIEGEKERNAKQVIENVERELRKVQSLYLEFYLEIRKNKKVLDPADWINIKEETTEKEEEKDKDEKTIKSAVMDKDVIMAFIKRLIDNGKLEKNKLKFNSDFMNKNATEYDWSLVAENIGTFFNEYVSNPENAGNWRNISSEMIMHSFEKNYVVLSLYGLLNYYNGQAPQLLYNEILSYEGASENSCIFIESAVVEGEDNKYYKKEDYLRKHYLCINPLDSLDDEFDFSSEKDTLTNKYPNLKYNKGDYYGYPNNPNAKKYKKLISSGEAVKAIQEGVGLSGENISGQFDSTTDKAVQGWQTAKGLQVDGIVEEKTWYSIFQQSTIKAQGDRGDEEPGMTALSEDEAAKIIAEETTIDKLPVENESGTPISESPSGNSEVDGDEEEQQSPKNIDPSQIPYPDFNKNVEIWEEGRAGVNNILKVYVDNTQSLDKNMNELLAGDLWIGWVMGGLNKIWDNRIQYDPHYYDTAGLDKETKEIYLKYYKEKFDKSYNVWYEEWYWKEGVKIISNQALAIIKQVVDLAVKSSKSSSPSPKANKKDLKSFTKSFINNITKKCSNKDSKTNNEFNSVINSGENYINSNFS